MEIIVVDDGSTDDTREILKEYGEKIHYIYQENKGISGARNAGILRARGDIITFLDSDDLYNAARLEKVAYAFRDRPEAGMVFHPLELVDRDGRTLYKNFNDAFGYEAELGGWIAGKVFSGRIFCGGSSFAFTRSVIDSICPIPEDIRVGVDYYMTAIAACCMPASCVPDVLGKYRSHTGNITMSEVKCDRRKLAILNREFAHMRQRLIEKIMNSHGLDAAITELDLIRIIQSKETIIYHFLDGRRMEAIRHIPSLFKGKKGLQNLFRGIAVSFVTMFSPAFLYPMLLRVHEFLRRSKLIRF